MFMFVRGTSVSLKRHTILLVTTEWWFKDIVSSRIHSRYFGSIHSRLPVAQLVYTAAE